MIPHQTIKTESNNSNSDSGSWAHRVRTRTRGMLGSSFHGVSSVVRVPGGATSGSTSESTTTTSSGGVNPLGLFSLARTSQELRASLSSRSGSESPVFDSSHSTESCPASVLATSSSIDSGSPTPDPNTRSTRFSWRKKPLDLLKMVEGHFTIDDSEAAGSTSPWEVIQMSNSSSPSPFPETPTDLPLPEMIGSSDILGENHRRYVCKHLPARAEGYTWNLLYSTAKHGFSLKSIYREMANVDSPVLLVIEDTVGSIFGALTSCPLKTSDLFYGTGETFLFLFDADGEFLKFPWTGDNMYFIKGNQNSLVIGSGDGTFGLWLDEDLCHGRTQPCRTFANPRLAKQEDFVVKTLECWGFI